MLLLLKKVYHVNGTHGSHTISQLNRYKVKEQSQSFLLPAVKLLQNYFKALMLIVCQTEL